jgi:hypothetical protein
MPETRGVGAKRQAIPKGVFDMVERYWLKERKAAAAKAAAASARKKAGGKGSGRDTPGEEEGVLLRNQSSHNSSKCLVFVEM